jgi:hypothetical protein
MSPVAFSTVNNQRFSSIDPTDLHNQPPYAMNEDEARRDLIIEDDDEEEDDGESPRAQLSYMMCILDEVKLLLSTSTPN